MWEHDPFYDSKEWRKKRKDILRRDHNECQLCKGKGKFARATTVHHIKPRQIYPELELCDYYTDEDGKQQRNLISVCRDCHESVCHPERLRHTVPGEPVTAERWD